MYGRGLAVFLDRDGVINADRPDFVKSWREFEFLPGALDALALLAETPYRVVVLTNQSGVGRGLLTEATLRDMHHRMLDCVRASAGRIDAIYYCPHVPDDRCTCRKPAPGMFLRASADLNIDLTCSWMVGDRLSDVEAAAAAGVRSILISNGVGAGGHLQASDFLDAARLLHRGAMDCPLIEPRT